MQQPPPSSRIRIMIVEDEAIVAQDLEALLTRAGYGVVGSADTPDDAIVLARERHPELALVDIRLRKGTDGVELAHRLYDELNIPVVFATAHGDTATFERARRSLPFGYLVKPYDEQALRIAIEVARSRFAAEQKIKELESWLSVTLRSIGDGVIVADTKGTVTLLNPMAEVLSGWSSAQAAGKPLSDVFALRIDGEACSERIINQVVESGAVFHVRGNAELRKRDGELLPIDDSVARIRDQQGRFAGVVVVFRDRSAELEAEEQRRKLEAKMYESQRLESLGVLAGGVAHDFNNLLAVILGNASLIEPRVQGLPRVPDWLASIQEAARQGAGLCTQMLAYAGRGSISNELIDINAAILSTLQLLRVSAGRRVRFSTELAPGLSPVMGDRSRIQQLIMNLVINAAEAIEDGAGVVVLRTSMTDSARVEPSPTASPSAGRSGRYVTIEVADDGRGMTEEVMSKIFDPFYTTKFQGRGLGLAAVRGIVESHGGTLKVESTVGKGSTFTVYLPESETAPNALAGPNGRPRVHVTGPALVVDDDDLVRDMARGLLEELGFEVQQADSALRAIELVRDHPSRYQIVLMDEVMPVLSGSEAVVTMRALAPTLPIIIMSGYADQQNPAGVGNAQLRKPFSLEELAEALVSVLAR